MKLLGCCGGKKSADASSKGRLERYAIELAEKKAGGDPVKAQILQAQVEMVLEERKKCKIFCCKVKKCCNRDNENTVKTLIEER